jgi:DNA-binding LacI/PurR family transcriptional regulator
VSRVTIVDVARAAGVSVTAVSLARNHPERLGKATLQRILEIALGMGYTPLPAARELSACKRRNRVDDSRVRLSALWEEDAV